jgi:hypothetical protein
MRATIVLALAMTTLNSSVIADARLSGKEGEAIAIAVQTFKSKQGSKMDGAPVYGDLRHYTIALQRGRNRLEITFVPEQPPLKRNEAGTGGSTIYGWEVVYVFSLSPVKMLDEHYAR